MERVDGRSAVGVFGYRLHETCTDRVRDDVGSDRERIFLTSKDVIVEPLLPVILRRSECPENLNGSLPRRGLDLRLLRCRRCRRRRSAAYTARARGRWCPTRPPPRFRPAPCWSPCTETASGVCRTRGCRCRRRTPARGRVRPAAAA